MTSYIDSFFRKTKKQKFVIKKDYRNLKEKFLRNFLPACGCRVTHLYNNLSLILLALDNLNGLIKFKKIFKGRLIYASSGSVYSQISGLCEDTPIGDPTNIYDFTKVTIDKYFSYKVKLCFIKIWYSFRSFRKYRTELLLNNMTLDV